MRGEVKGARSKRCLSRNKRSKPEKSSENDCNSDETASGIYTAVQSKQPALLHSDEKSYQLGLLATESTDDTSSTSDNCGEEGFTATTSIDHQSDAFDFCDEVTFDESKYINKSCSYKRKRIDSEEHEPSGFTNIVSKFKRSRSALNNLKQPLICLENCIDVNAGSQSGRSRTDKFTEKNKQGTCIEHLSTAEGYLHHDQLLKVDNITVDGLLTVDSKVGNVHDGKTIDDTKPQDNSEDFSRNQVCPVCSFKFLPKDEMDVINEHINSCLDNGCDSSNKKNVLPEATCDDIGEELFFCQLCQKDLSRMNSQRRQQHVNRCCDQAGKAEEMPPLSTVPSQLQCPICGKGFKSSKSRQSHLKKCAQEFNVGTNQLLEIVNREKQKEESTSSAVRTEVNTASSANVQPARNSTGVKRKRRGATHERDLDEETQLALALSASMAPPPPPATQIRKGGRGRGKKNQGGSELPALLLRDDKTAQRAVALRAAQVLCTQEDNDEDEEISCTPALAPSRLAQNIPSFQPVDPVRKEMESEDLVDDLDSKVDDATESDHKMEEDNLMDIDNGNESEEVLRKSAGVTAIVDPLLSRSFLNSLCDVDFEESQLAEMKAPQTGHLWSLAAAKDESSISFYVPGLLPPASPRRQQKLPINQFTTLESPAKESILPKKCLKQVDNNDETKKVSRHEAAQESVAQLELTTTENDEPPEITPSQAANVEMLLELVGEDDISNVSISSQQVITATCNGFCIDEQEEEDKESVTVPSGVSKLLEDLSSMINNSYLSDVVINLKDGQEITAHSFILSLRSEVLAQLLKERKALQENTESGGRTDRVALMFQEIGRSAFEVVLKHIYTGDVIIPEHCELDDVMILAERFRLPCLLTACKKAQLRLKQALENLDDDETGDYIVTDVAQVEQDLWKSYNDDDTSENVQTAKNKDNEDEDDFLNDDDIEEIMIFQTQSLQRKASERGVDEREDEKSEEEVISTGSTCTHIPSKFCDEVSGDKPSFLTSEETEQMFGKPLKDDALSCRPFEEGKVPRSPWEKDNLSGECLEEGNVSRYPVEEDKMPRNRLEKDNVSDSPVDEGSVSRNRVEESNLALNSRGNGANVAEEEDKVSCPKEHVIEEDVIIKYVQSPLREDSAIRKQLWNIRDCCEGNQLFSCDENAISHASSRERVCVQEAELISDSDDVEAQPEDLMHESTERRAVKRDLGKSYGVDKEVSHVEETAEVGFELQNDVDCTPIHNVSADLLNGENEEEYGDLVEKDVSEKIQDTLADLNPVKNGHVNRCMGSSKTFSNEPVSLPSGDGGWDDEEVFHGSPGEITVPCDVESDDEMEEMALNESITLISDNEEEVLDVSPPKTDITIVPETPGVRGRISTKSSSTLSVTEEDDVTVTGSSPSKSRKQLTEEANEFLSKLKKRAERGKEKRQGKKTAKKNCGGKRSPVEIPPKQTTPTKSSPVKNQEAQVGRFPLSPARHSNPLTASPVQMSPRGSKSPSVSPTWTFPRVCNSPGVVTAQTSRVCKSSIGSLMLTPPGKSPRGFNPRSVSPIAVDECCVSDVVTNHVIGNSPPVSPDLHQLHDLPQTSETEEKGRESLGEKEFDYGEPNDVEIVEACVDRAEDRICEGLALSPSSSPPDVMSPPVPSPSYSFLDHVSSPGSPVPYASPMPEKSVLLADRVSPSSPLDWKSPASERNLESRVQPNSPVSPSVCSYRQHVVRDLCSQDSRKDAVDFERRLNDKEKPRNVEVVEIDRNLPLMERLKAARGGGHKIFSLGEDEDVCDKNSDDCTRNNVETGENKSPISSQREKAASSQQEMNASISAEFDFYDDGGFIFGVDELNNLEDGLENDDHVMTREEGNSKELSNQCKVMARKKGSKEVPGKRKIPPSQRRVQDSDDDDSLQQGPSKRGKKTDTQPTKHAGQTVAQPVTPMPNYNEMATPTLKNELHKFGVRPLPKKKMILKLKEIYDYTHQVEPRPQGSKAERAPSKDRPLSSNAAGSDTAGGVEGSGTASSDNSDEEDTEFGDCTVMIEDDIITASQQVNGGNLKEKLVRYFGDNEELYKKVLRYQPLELVSLQQQIKSDGINCPLGKLVDFLDQQCVTFTTAGSRPRAPKKRGRKKKN